LESTENVSKRNGSANGHRYYFDGFEIDPQNRLLQRDGANITIPAKVFDVLLVFAENPGRLLKKDELIERVCHEGFVEEGNLARHVSTLRKALAGNGGEAVKWLNGTASTGFPNYPL
jgi:DNA-binding winged helix-turn-helix (wHTH) protein